MFVYIAFKAFCFLSSVGIEKERQNQVKKYDLFNAGYLHSIFRILVLFRMREKQSGALAA